MRFNLIKWSFIIPMLFGIVSACHPSNKNTENSIAVERTDTCLSNPAHSYEVFVPNHTKSDQKFPLLVAIDPHGSGQTAMEHLKEAASKYTVLLVASNLIQNNDPHYLQELDELIADVKKRYPIGDRLYLAGFSGGARMTLGYAFNHSVDGVITCGAFASPEQLSAIKCPVMGLIGMDDFNFLETVQYILNPASLPANAHIELMKASHEWPESSLLTAALGWFELSEGSNTGHGGQQVVQYVKAQKGRVDSLVAAGELLSAVCIGRTMASVERFEKVGSFYATTNELTNRAAYKQQLSQLRESLQLEMNLRQIYVPALLEKNEAWWKKEIAALNEKMASEPDDMKKMAYKRVNGFLGIACYSYARQFAVQKDINHLEQILMVYRLIAPDNTEMQRLTKVLDQLKGQQ